MKTGTGEAKESKRPSRLVERAWESLPRPVKDGAKRAWAGYALLTSSSRVLPEFLIIGTQRAGTTSLYKYLVKHPAVAQALTKELRFFDLNYDKGIRWYRSRFPSRRYRQLTKRRTGLDLVVGEGSPDYLFHPHAPHRVARFLPDAKLIVLLRNPVDRAYSHYWHQVKRGFETLSFEQAVDREPERLEGELEKMLRDERYLSFERHHHSYLARGLYVTQLRTWMDLFPRERFLIERAEAFFQEPSLVFNRVLEFLGLPPFELDSYDTYNAFSEGAMNPETHRRLATYFRPHNEQLYEFLGRDFGWEA